VPCDRRRARILEAVRAFGIGSQLSAHECLISPGERRELWRRLADIGDAAEDRMLLLVLDPRLPVTAIGAARAPMFPSLVYVG
jgi:CRISPR associated protein Cas2.